MIAQENFVLWIAVGAFAAISLVILVLLARAPRHKAHAPPGLSDAVRQTLRDRIWTFAPACMFVLVAATVMGSVYLQNTAPPADLTITVTGHMWYWTYRYSNYGNLNLTAPMLANSPGEKPVPPRAYDHIMVPVNKTVRIVAVATNVIYSWEIPDIGARIEAVPGLNEKSWFKPVKEGRYYGQCSELCGLPHTFRPVEIEVVSQVRFDKWAADAKARLAAAPRQNTAEEHS